MAWCRAGSLGVRSSWAVSVRSCCSCSSAFLIAVSSLFLCSASLHLPWFLHQPCVRACVRVRVCVRACVCARVRVR
jgi:hypothetical protein